MTRAVQAKPAVRPTLSRRLAAEAIGSFFLFCAVIGSGIMGEALSDGNTAIALLGNTLATGAVLFVIILIFAPLSGAHFNPAVTLIASIRGELARHEAPLYVLVQLIGGIAGVWAAHLMFDLDILQLSTKTRAGAGQLTGEAIATFGLIFTILGTVRYRPAWVAPAVGLYISAGYWFTSSTSFANPAITIARALSDTFAGIAIADVGPFIAAQIAGALLAGLIAGWLFAEPR